MYNRRRSLSPPGRDRRPPPPRDPYDRRRGRSPTPERYRRSPPPYKRFRRDDEPYDIPPRGYSDYRRSEYPSPRDRDAYGDRDPYMERDQRRSPPPREKEGPMSYKEFMQQLADDVTPDVAAQQYQDYLTSFWGDAIRAEFETKKHEDWVRDKYDPRRILARIQRRNENAKQSQADFDEDYRNDKLDPKSDAFNQGNATADAGKSQTRELLVVAWDRKHVDSDLALSQKLIRKLDSEKSLDRCPFSWIAAAEKGSNATDGDDADKPQDATPVQRDGSEAPTEDREKPEPSPDAEADQSQQAEKDETMADAHAAGEANGDTPLEDVIGKLDLQLTYLWRVHGIDYYSGTELQEAEFQTRLSKGRTIRPPKSEEDISEDQRTKFDKQYESEITSPWNKRMENADPARALLQEDKVEENMTQFLNGHVQNVADSKFKCGVPNCKKMFVAIHYVSKHIRTKHKEYVEEQEEKLYDEVYFDNFRRAREEERRQEDSHAADDAHGGYPSEGDGAMDGDMHGPGRGGRGRRGGGRGRMGMMRGGMMMDAPMMPPMMAPLGMNMGMGGMGPIFVPAPGPMGPMMMMPMGDMPPFEPGFGPRRGRGGGRRGRGGPPFMMGHPGGGMDPRGMRGYFDLDNPSNNRAVLDYGDL